MCLLTRKCLLVFKLIVQFVANVKAEKEETVFVDRVGARLCVCCLLYTSPSPRDVHKSRMPSSA